MMKYFSKHLPYALSVHMLGGIGAGIIFARPLAGDHPVRWGAGLLIISLAGHVWAARR